MRIKILTLLTGLFLFSNLTFAQSVGEYRVRKTETVTKKIEKEKKPKVVRENNPERRGFYVMPEVGIFGVSPLSASGKLAFGLQGVCGYDINNHLALGIGTGLKTVVYKGLFLPLYVNFRGDITKKQIAKVLTPYYSINFGYNICVKEHDSRYIDGLLFTLELGIRINNFHIGTEFMITEFTKFHYVHYNYSNHYSKYPIYNVIGVLSLKLGYKIPLNFKR